MPRITFEPLAVLEDEQHNGSSSERYRERPPWAWILRHEIIPLGAVYGLIIEYNDETDESCAIFYDDVWVEEDDEEEQLTA